MTNLDEIRQQLDLLSDEELIAILQERNTDQWRPEVFDIVASILNTRGVRPQTDLKPEEEDVPDNGLELLTVANYASEIDAETDRLALETNGLKAWIVDHHSIMAPVKLQVYKEDWPKAMRILEPEPPDMVPSSDLPPDIAEPPCPKCGSRKVMEDMEGVEILESSETLLGPEQVWLYRCASCGHKWTESST